MDVIIHPNRLSGTVEAPASKSEAHRLLICAALADSPTRIELNASSDDIDATVGCLRALGAVIEEGSGFLDVRPALCSDSPAAHVCDCRESGSTLRFMLPVAAAMRNSAKFTGSGRLPSRPVGELLDAMSSGGVSFTSDRLPLETRGRLRSGSFSIAGNVSSQYITGLLLAMPMLPDGGAITLTSPLQSPAYVDITISVMKDFGAGVTRTEDGFAVKPGGYRSPGSVKAAGDWSGAAFFLTAGALGGPVSVAGLRADSRQGDRKILDLLRGFGADVREESGLVTVSRGERTQHRITIDIDPTPDLLPILAVIAACTDGVTEFVNGARLRIKESDRIKTTAAIINSLGCGAGCAHAEETEDGLIVTGGRLRGGTVDGAGDHRIVMAAAIAASMCENDVAIRGAEAVSKSYTSFFDDYSAAGGDIDVVAVR